MKIHNSLRTRRGLKLAARLLREESVFAAAIVDGWPAEDAHDLARALKWIDGQPLKRSTKVRRKKLALSAQGGPA